MNRLIVLILLGAFIFASTAQSQPFQAIRVQAPDGRFPFAQGDSSGVLRVVMSSGLTLADNDTTTATTVLDSLVFDPVLVHAVIMADDDVDVWINSTSGDPWNITAFGVLAYNAERYSIFKIYFRTRTGTSLVTIGGSRE